MIIERIELSKARIQLEELSMPDGMRKRTVQFITEEEGYWANAHEVPPSGFPFQVSHPAHHWSREVVEWMKFINPQFLVEYLNHVPSSSLCFDIPESTITIFHSNRDLAQYAKWIKEAMKETNRDIDVFLLEERPEPSVLVYLGESDSFAARYGELEDFLSLLSQLIKLMEVKEEFLPFLSELEVLIRSVYALSFKEWLPIELTKDPYSDDADFLLGLINGVPLESLIATYCHQNS